MQAPLVTVPLRWLQNVDSWSFVDSTSKVSYKGLQLRSGGWTTPGGLKRVCLPKHCGVLKGTLEWHRSSKHRCRRPKCAEKQPSLTPRHALLRSSSSHQARHREEAGGGHPPHRRPALFVVLLQLSPADLCLLSFYHWLRQRQHSSRRHLDQGGRDRWDCRPLRQSSSLGDWDCVSPERSHCSR